MKTFKLTLELSSELMPAKQRREQNAAFLECLLDCWKVRDNLNVGFGVAFIGWVARKTAGVSF